MAKDIKTCATCEDELKELNEQGDCANCEIIYGFHDDELYPDEDSSDDYCPSCRLEYDEIDREFQICHFCKFDNNI